VLAALVGCEGRPLEGASAPPADAAVGTRSTFAVATPAGLIGFSADAKELGQIVQLPVGVPSSPTLDPAGKVIVFSLSRVADAADPGSDIYGVRVDGTDLRLLLKHERPNVFYASPTFDRSTGFLYVHRRAVDLSDLRNPAASRTLDSVERVDMRSGEHRTVLTDAAEPTFSPDGKTVVFVHISHGELDGLWTARPDGGIPGPLFKTRDTFVFMQAPRVSPTGREVVFCSAGHVVTQRSPPPAAGSAGGGRLAHLGVPSEVFIAPLDGTGLRSIATTGDDVVPAWSPDGDRVAFIAQGTFYVVSASDGAVKLAQPIAFRFGDPVWLH